MNTNLLVTIDGPDGIGKTTIINELKSLMKDFPVVYTRDPGTCQSAELIRNIVKGDYDIDKYSELLLYTAARNEVVDKVIIPSINNGNICVIDRFAVSTVVYQTTDEYRLKDILDLSIPIIHKMIDKLEIYNYVLLADSNKIKERKKTKTDELDHFDKLDSEKLVTKYKHAAIALSDIDNFLFENMRIIDANGSAKETAKIIFDDLLNIINKEEGEE